MDDEIKELLFKKNLESFYEFIVDDYKTNLYTNVVKILSQNKVKENQAIRSTTSSTLGSKLKMNKKKCEKDSNQEKKIQQIVTRLLSYPFTELYVSNDNLDKIKYKKTLENGDVVAVVHSDSVGADKQCRENSFNIGKITKKSSTTLGGTKYEISILDDINVSNITNQGEKSIISLTIDSNNLDDNVKTKTDNQKKDKSENFFKEATNKDKLDKILNDNNSYDKIISNLKGLLSEVEGGATSAPSAASSGSKACEINLELKKAGGGNKKPNITMELREKNTRRRKKSRRHKYKKSVKKNRKNKKKQTKKLRKHRKKTYKRK